MQIGAGDEVDAVFYFQYLICHFSFFFFDRMKTHV